MRFQMFTWFSSTVVAIDAQIHINTMQTSIPPSPDLLWTAITCNHNLKVGWIPSYEQTDVSLDINLCFQPVLVTPGINSNCFGFLKITFVALVHFNLNFLFIHFWRDYCTCEYKLDVLLKTLLRFAGFCFDFVAVFSKPNLQDLHFIGTTV